VRAVPLARSLAPLRHRRFAAFWTGAFVSNIGTWMQTVAIGIYVTDLTGQAAWTGAVAAAGFVPVAVLAPLGGALADRFERRRMLIVGTLLQTALAGLLTALFVAGRPGPALVTLIVLADGVASALTFPAYSALLPDLVPTDDLLGAVALSSAQWNLGRVVGPVLAGVVIKLGGYAWALGVNTVSFFAVVAVLLVLHPPRPEPDEGVGVFASIVAGWRFVRADAGLRIVVLAMCLNTFCAAPFIALVPAMAQVVHHSGPGGTSLLVTAQGLGAVGMGLSLGPLGDTFGPRTVMLAMMGSLPVALTLYALAPTLALSAVAIFFVGAAYLGALSSFSTIAQLRAPRSLRGRVLSLNMMVLGSLYPFGSLVQGAVADRTSLPTVTAGAAVLMALVMVAVRVLRPGITDPIAAGAGPVDAGPATVAESPA
jgi:MFS family permease